jgi:hypothetical protein
MRNWSPDEALPAITAAGRRLLTIGWLLQEPGQLAPIHCFMTIGSRKPRGSVLILEHPLSGSVGAQAVTAK